MYFRDPFKLVPITNIAEIADKFARNEIMSSNEIRQVIGMKPSTDPKADKLQNSNMPIPVVSTSTTNTAQSTSAAPQQTTAPIDSAAQDAIVNGVFSNLEDHINQLANTGG